MSLRIFGSTVGLTDGAGVITTSYTYEPYGKTTVKGSSNRTVAEGTVLVGTAGYATGLFTSGVQKAMGKPVTAGTVFWNVVGSVTGGVIGGPATATLLSSVARRLLTSVFSIGKGIAASTASAPSSAGSASNSGSPASSGSRVLGK